MNKWPVLFAAIGFLGLIGCGKKSHAPSAEIYGSAPSLKIIGSQQSQESAARLHGSAPMPGFLMAAIYTENVTCANAENKAPLATFKIRLQQESYMGSGQIIPSNEWKDKNHQPVRLRAAQYWLCLWTYENTLNESLINIVGMRVEVPSKILTWDIFSLSTLTETIVHN